MWQVEGIEQERRARTVSETLCRLEGVFEAQQRLAASEPSGWSSTGASSTRPGSGSGAGLARCKASAIRDGRNLRFGPTRMRPSRLRSPPLPASTRTIMVRMKPSAPILMTRARATPTAVYSGRNTELYFALISGVALATGFALSWTGAAPELVSTGLYLTAYFFGGFFTVREAIDSLKLRRFEIDTLMLVAAAAGGRGTGANGQKAPCCSSCSALVIRLSTTPWVRARKKAIEALGKACACKRRTVRAREMAAPKKCPVEGTENRSDVIVSGQTERTDRLPTALVTVGTSAASTRRQSPVKVCRSTSSLLADPTTALAEFEQRQPGRIQRCLPARSTAQGLLTIHGRADGLRPVHDGKASSRWSREGRDAQRSPTQQFTDRNLNASLSLLVLATRGYRC